MYCPKCGNNIADESAKFCPVCGYELNNTQQSGFKLASEQSNMNNQQQNSGYGQPVYNSQPGGTYQQPMNNTQPGGGYGQPVNNTQPGGVYQQPMYNSQPVGGYGQPAVSQPPKQNTGLIIGIIIGAIVLIAAIVIFLVFFVFKKDDTGNTGNKDTTSPQTVEDTQDDPLPDDINTSEEDISTSEDTVSGDIELGTYSISLVRLEGQELGYSDIESMGYGEMTLRVEHDYIYFKETANGYDVPYYYTDSNGTGKIWNSAEEYTIYYTNDTITIDFASSDQFSEYTEYTITFSK